MKTKILFWMLSATCLLLSACSSEKGKNERGSQAKYKTLTTERSDQMLKSTYSARLTGRQIVEVRPQVSGNITRICINEGQQVTKGQTLFVIDQVPYQAALEVAKASVATAQAKLETARMEYESSQTLREGQVVSDYTVQTSLNALNEAKAYNKTYVGLGLTYTAEDLEGVALPTEDWTIEEHSVNAGVPNIRRGFGISVTCPSPEKVIAMWEEFMKPEWQLIFNWGFVDEDYIINEDGRLDRTQEQIDNANNSSWQLQNTAAAIFGNSPKRQGTILEDIVLEDGRVVKAGNMWEPGNQPEIVFGQMNEYDKNFLAQYNFQKFADFVNPPLELAPWGEAWELDYTPVKTANTKFEEIQDAMLPAAIMAAPEEFDAAWDAFVNEISPYAKEFGDYMQQAVIVQAAKYFAAQED